MPFAGSSLFPLTATNAEILPHDQCVFRRYAIILSPTHPTKSRSLYSPCSTVAEAHACSRPSFVGGNESPSRNKYQLVRQTARHRFSKHSPDFCFSLPMLRTWVRSPPPLPNQFVFCDLQSQFLTKPCFLTIRFNSPVLLNDAGRRCAAHHRQHGHKLPALFVRQSDAVVAVRQPGLH